MSGPVGVGIPARNEAATVAEVVRAARAALRAPASAVIFASKPMRITPTAEPCPSTTALVASVVDTETSEISSGRNPSGSFATAARIAFRRSASTSTAPPGGTPAMISARMRCGSSVRGLSLVTYSRSAKGRESS